MIQSKDAEIERLNEAGEVLHAKMREQDAEIERLRGLLNGQPIWEARAERLAEAIRWALGEVDAFPPRQSGQGAYWWRAELRRRAALGEEGK